MNAVDAVKAKLPKKAEACECTCEAAEEVVEAECECACEAVEEAVEAPVEA